MAACAHNSNLNEMIVYGGLKEGGTFATVFDARVLRLNLNGVESWSEMATTGGPPPARAAASLVYDADGNRMILFGGTSGTYLNDVWALDLGTHAWSPLFPSGTAPAPRAFHTAIYDPGHRRMVVFGGSTGSSTLNDTWELSLSGTPTWSPLVTVGTPPGPRSDHSAVFDPQGRMLVFGGQGYNDTWQLTLPADATTPTWSPLATLGTPTIRYDHAAVFDEANDRMIVFGGRETCVGQTCPHRLNDVWILALSTLQWSQPSLGTYAPAEREFPVAVYDAAHQRLVVFGGSGGCRESYCQGSILGDTWSVPFDATPQWKALTPPLRAFAALTWDEVRHRMIVFGGLTAGQKDLRDLWAYDPTPPGHWENILPAGSAPLARDGATLVHDVANDRFLLFGGKTGFNLNDLWAFSPDPPTWIQLSPTGGPPPARSRHTAVMDPAGGRMVVFGGIDLGPRNDTWTLSTNGPPVWSQPPSPNPPARYLHAAVYDPVDWNDATVGHMVVFGGMAGGVQLSDTPDWIASATPFWNSLVAGSPPARYSAAASYDGARDQMLIFGGISGGTSVNDLWALPFYGTKQWSPQSPSGTPPLPREGAGAVYDPIHDRMLVLGGRAQDQFVLNEFWQLDRSGVPVAVGGPEAAELRLGPIRPNPSHGRVRLDLVLPHASQVQLAVFDLAGRRVHLSTRSLPAGRHELEWDGRSTWGTRASAGLYLAQVRTGGREQVRRFVLLP